MACLPIEAFKLTTQLSDEDLNDLKPFIYEERIDAGDYIYREGDPSNCLYLLRSGSATFVKQSHTINDPLYGTFKGKKEVPFKLFLPGDMIGETGYVDGLKRAQSIKAKDDCSLFIIKYDELKKYTQTTVTRMQVIDRHLVANLSHRLRASDALIIRKASYLALLTKKRVFIASFFINFLLCALAYVLLLSYMSDPALKHFFKISSAPLLLFFLVMMLLTKNKPPFKMYGITLDNLKQSIIEGLIFTVVFCSVITLAKIALITYIPACHSLPIIDLPAAKNMIPFMILAFIYLLSSPAQEFLVRGALQAPLEYLLGGKHRVWKSIVLSNLIFSSLHLQIDHEFALAVFIPGLFWGWLFHRSRNIIGVSISHFIIGLYAIYFIGAIKILQ